MAATSQGSVCRERDYTFVLGNTELDFKSILIDAYDTDIIMAGIVADNDEGGDVGYFTVVDTITCASLYYFRLSALVSVDAVHRNKKEKADLSTKVYYYLVA